MEERYLVEHVCEPLALLLPVYVETPEGVVERFRSHRHLCGERLFRQVLEGTAELEVLGEVVFPVQSEHRLPLLCVVGIALERHVDCRSGIDDALVEDCRLSCRIVHAIV